jgi:hypothetical protein
LETTKKKAAFVAEGRWVFYGFDFYPPLDFMAQ